MTTEHNETARKTPPMQFAVRAVRAENTPSGLSETAQLHELQGAQTAKSVQKPHNF